MVTPVLHELRRQLDSIPLHPPDARDVANILLGEHMLKCVPHFVEERLHLPERHQRGLVPNRWGLVAHHVRHGKAGIGAIRGKYLAAPHHLIHPGAPALLRRPRVRVQVEVRLQSALNSQSKKLLKTMKATQVVSAS